MTAARQANPYRDGAANAATDHHRRKVERLAANLHRLADHGGYPAEIAEIADELLQAVTDLTAAAHKQARITRAVAKR